MKSDRLIHALQSDTAVLTSALGWLEEEEAKVVRNLASAELPELYKLQGEARGLRKLRDSLSRMAKVKDDHERPIRTKR